MIKQFNFYDIYGYLLPGIALLGIMWIPKGVITGAWPDQDISKALFLAALAYFLGHLLQTIATNAIPSKVMIDEKGRPRFPSEMLLDSTGTALSRDFKIKLSQQVRNKFGLNLHVEVDGDGTGTTFSDRNTAFFLARSFLIAKKTAPYVEQFEGLYAMMRGLACASLAGAFYLAGWALAFHRESECLRVITATAGILGVIVAVICSVVGLSRKSSTMKRAVVALATALLVVFWAAGFWIATWQSDKFWNGASFRMELVLWIATCLTLIASARFFSSYRSFATQFAQSVWRDFSVHLTVEAPAANGHSQSDENGDNEDE